MKRPQWLDKHRKQVLTTYIALAVIAGLASPLPAFVLKYWPLQWADFTGMGWDSTVEKSIERDAQGNFSKDVTKTTINSGKKLWDWLSLLGVPLSLALLGFWFQSKQQQRTEEQKAIEQRRTEEQRAIEQKRAEDQAALEREIADENRREEALQTYFDRVSTLLVDKNLLAIAAKGEEATREERELLSVSVDVIRARILSILRRLEGDAERKTSLIRFLIEAEVISKLKLDLSTANLSRADLIRANLICANLSGAELNYANLSIANLSGANLSDANLSSAICPFANLSGADFSRANLNFAILSFADLSFASFSFANLSNADLSSADLSFANLSNASLSNTNLSHANLSFANLAGTYLSAVEGIRKEQLEGDNAPFLCNTPLPEGISVNSNRDCDRLPQVLLARYPKQFKTLEEAEAYVDQAQKRKWE